jgi:hypothetical protein
MTKKKYENLIKTLQYQNYPTGPIRQGLDLTSEYLGIDVCIKYGCAWMAGRLGKEPYSQPHVHDFDQVMLFLGTDMNDMSDLWGEVEFCIGEELEKHIITCSTAIAIPKGMPHFPATINRMDKRIIVAEISIAKEYSEKPFVTNNKPSEPVGMRPKYMKNIQPILFRRKGAWVYGPTNPDDGGGTISFIMTKDAGFDFVALYESMKKAPYRIGPNPDKPHAHPTTQCMMFLGTDPTDLSKLNAEFEICIGKEEEKYTFTSPTAVVCPPFIPHWPGGTLAQTKPILFFDVHPFGNDH